MKILLVNQAFYPDAAATAQYLTDLALTLAREGHHVTTLAARRGYVDPSRVYPGEESYRGIRILRVWPYRFGRKKILRAIEAFFVNLALGLRFLCLPHQDCVVCLTSPPLVSVAVMAIARIRKTGFAYWMMDINPDEAITAGWIRKGSIYARVLEAALRYVLRRSDKIVVLDRFMKDRVVLKGASPDKVHVIPPWAHDQALETIPHEENPFRKEHGLEGKFVVMYSGNHSICHPLDTLLETALLMKDDPSTIFLFVGGGDRVRDVLQFKERHGLSNIMHLPYVPRERLKYSLSAADLHAVVMGDAYAGIVHPSKIYGILCVGRPFVFIGPEQSHIGDLIAEKGIGFRIGHGEAEGLKQIIDRFRGMSSDPKNQCEKKIRAEAKGYCRTKLEGELVRLITGENSNA